MSTKSCQAKHNLDAWLSYFETLHPVGIDMGLERVSRVWDRLCQHYQIKRVAQRQVISVAGTNGKGSACQMLSLLLISQGYRVGLYTSPHIHHFNERVKINQQSVSNSLLEKAFKAIDNQRGDITLSYFEATTLAGLLVFAWQQVDFAILEVGLGGRLDAINLIDADAALITSIGLDHKAFLGTDLAQIAVEKAGIFRPHRPAVYADNNSYQSVIDYCKSKHIPLWSLHHDYHIENEKLFFQGQYYDLPDKIKQQGDHQIRNVCGVIVVLALLDLLPDNLSVLADFYLPGRLEKIAQHPDIIIDVAHNEAAANALADFINKEKKHYDNIYAVVGMLADKDHQMVMKPFNGLFKKIFLGSTYGDRGLTAQQLAKYLDGTLTPPVQSYHYLSDALKAAKQQATPKDLILAFGSFLVAESLQTKANFSQIQP